MFVLGDGYDSEVFFELLYQLCQHQAQYLFVVFGGIVVVYRRLPVSEHHGDESEGAAFVVAGDEPDVFRGCLERIVVVAREDFPVHYQMRYAPVQFGIFAV
mgnify:FL=1